MKEYNYGLDMYRLYHDGEEKFCSLKKFTIYIRILKWRMSQVVCLSLNKF